MWVFFLFWWDQWYQGKYAQFSHANHSRKTPNVYHRFFESMLIRAYTWRVLLRNIESNSVHCSVGAKEKEKRDKEKKIAQYALNRTSMQIMKWKYGYWFCTVQSADWIPTVSEHFRRYFVYLKRLRHETWVKSAKKSLPSFCLYEQMRRAQGV